ncbi:MAG TPA: hypothetical protein VI384_07705 [Candidatus Dormibacteraeota bacterium]
MRKVLLAGAALLMIGACGLPFGLGRPSTAQLENGAADNMAKAKSFEAKGSMTQDSKPYTFDIEYVAPSDVHISAQQAGLNFEVLQVNGSVYYKGTDYLNSLTTDADAKKVFKAAGSRWITSKDIQSIDTSSITDVNKVKASFLTTIAQQRTDDVTVDGRQTAELTLSDSILNISEDQPYQLVRVRSVKGKTVNGVTDMDMTFSNYGKDFSLSQPTDAFNLDDPTTWPPYYQVDSVSQKTVSGTTSCDDPCVLSAVIENRGGVNGASAPSTVTFSLTSDTDNSVLGSCKVTIQPDKPHAQKFNASCSIQSSAWTNFSGNYHYRADIDNPAFD